MLSGKVAATGQHGTIYFVTGGGGAPLYNVSGDFWTAYKAEMNEFTRTEIHGCQLTTQAIGMAGNVFDSVTLNKCASPLTPVGQSGRWNLMFDDEFNGPRLDASKWTTCYPWQTGTCSNPSNNELELYNQEDVLVDPGAGILRLRTQKRDMVGWNGQTFHYTSGIVTTGGIAGQQAPSFSYTYGYAEARVKVPKGQGLWPAFWLLPTTYAWPPEIDIMEMIGSEPNVENMTYHWTDAAGTAHFEDPATWTGPDFSTDYHVFGVDWTKDAIVWYVDGIERYRYSEAANIYNQPMYLLLNLAVGGDWPGAPDAATAFPSYLDVDYVRVWQRAQP
jgi:beta-glucanase (GH16 family)